MNRERAEIGHGYEHRVYRAMLSQPTVLKVPNTFNQIRNRFDAHPAQSAWQEFSNESQKIASESIKIPHTRFFPMNGSYIIAQDFIEEDMSVDKPRFFASQSQALQMNYELHPNNFISHEGNMYAVDPSRGFITRIFEKYNVLTKEEYWRIKLGVKKLFKKSRD